MRETILFYFNFIFLSFFFFHFLSRSCGIWRFPGQGWDQSHSRETILGSRVCARKLHWGGVMTCHYHAKLLQGFRKPVVTELQQESIKNPTCKIRGRSVTNLQNPSLYLLLNNVSKSQTGTCTDPLDPGSLIIFRLAIMPISIPCDPLFNIWPANLLAHIYLIEYQIQ